MNKKCFITGHTSGVGKALYDYFIDIGWEVQGFAHSNGWDIEKDVDKIASVAKGCDLFINNAYANGAQIALVKALFGNVKSMVVCGSVASEYPDPDRLEYSEHKKELDDLCENLSKEKNVDTDLMLIKLTSSSYKDTKSVINLVDFWLDNPSIITVKFNVEDK